MDMELLQNQSEVVKQFPSFRSSGPGGKGGNIWRKLPWFHRAKNSIICRSEQLGSHITKELFELIT